MAVRKCKKCGAAVQEDQALNTYEEFFDVFCNDCAAEIRAKQAEEAPQAAAERPQERPQEYPWPIYRQAPDGPIFKTEEKAELPDGAIFHGYIRTGPKRTDPIYQLFKFPPKLDSAALDCKAKNALEAGGFNLES